MLLEMTDASCYGFVVSLKCGLEMSISDSGPTINLSGLDIGSI